MKEATGELSMTVIVVVAVAAVAALFYTFVWPMIQSRIVDQTCKSYGEGYHATKTRTGQCIDYNTSQDDAGGTTWYCCK